jgi:hypothetical protein
MPLHIFQRRSLRQIGAAPDEAAIRSIVNHWKEAWDKFDASFLEGGYADDADWMNAYGDKKAFLTQSTIARPDRRVPEPGRGEGFVFTVSNLFAPWLQAST